jgi:predicted nucleotidyltransferase
MAFGIVCEYNPFHNGHLHQINEIKRTSSEPIICVMSGNFTQRGEIAIVDKYARAKMALLCGADLVLELPVPFCMASAEYFASSAISILARLNVDKLSFGSECADAEEIMKIAVIAASDEFKNECALLSKEQGNVSAYFDLLAQKSGVKGIKSNDILGIEYTKAIIKNGYNMQICPIKREGNAYRDTKLSLGELPSASAIREAISNNIFDNISAFVPNSTLEILSENELADVKRIKSSILFALRLIDADNLDVAISDRGLVNRILAMAHECNSFDEFEEKLQTKKYTFSAIRRAILYILLGVKPSDLDVIPQYTVLLGANEKGREYLASIRKNEGAVKVVTKPADAEGSRQFELSKKADAIYTLCFENKKDSGFYIKKSPVII